MSFLPDYSYRPMKKNPYFLGGIGLIATGLLAEWWSNRPVAAPDVAVEPPSEGKAGLLSTNLTPGQASAFKSALPPLGQQYAQLFVDIGREKGVSPFILAAIMERETGFGAGCRDPLPRCRGGDKHGHGLMQIDDRYHANTFFKQVVNGRPAYEDPAAGIRYGSDVYLQARDYIKQRTNLTGVELYTAAAAAYNGGPGRVVKALKRGRGYDSVTTGKNYGRDVIGRAGRFLSSANAALG